MKSIIIFLFVFVQISFSKAEVSESDCKILKDFVIAVMNEPGNYVAIMKSNETIDCSGILDSSIFTVWKKRQLTESSIQSDSNNLIVYKCIMHNIKDDVFEFALLIKDKKDTTNLVTDEWMSLFFKKKQINNVTNQKYIFELINISFYRGENRSVAYECDIINIFFRTLVESKTNYLEILNNYPFVNCSELQIKINESIQFKKIFEEVLLI